MKYFLPTILHLLFISSSLEAQGICDSVITIDPIQPICQGTGYDLLHTSHDWGDFSGPGTSPYNPYLDAENLNPGNYTITYTITGPGGCQVQATRDFEVLPAFETNAFVQGTIDCSNPASKAMVIGLLFPDPNGVTYDWARWEGPQGSGVELFGQSVQTAYAGTYKMTAYPSNGQGCPAFAFATVPFANNQLDINIISCTNCNGPGGTRITLDTFPAGWFGPVYSLQTGYFDNSNCRELMETGLLKATLTNETNGCITQAVKNFSSLEKTPAVSAGSDLGLWCGGAPNLLAATYPHDNGNGFSFYWQRPNGTTFPAFWGSLMPVTEPGTYVLHGVNLFTGCETTDASNVAPAPPLVGTEIKVVCDGESYLGHTQTGNYTDLITLPNGCEKTLYTKLIVLAPLVAETAISPDNGQQNGSISLTVTQGWAPYVYEWSNGETTSTISGLPTGNYMVVITDANGCQHVREYLVPSGKPAFPQVADRNIGHLIQARIYPNPVSANQAITLDVLSNQAQDASLLIQDFLGRTLSCHAIQLQEGKNQFNLIENLPAGSYAVFIKGDFGTKAVSKLLVTEGN